MREYEISTRVTVLCEDELSTADRDLILSARNATKSSYSPYSQFQVGAALRLADGEIILGNNQENASYPVGCCAERTALFWCSANRPEAVITAIAVAAQTGGRFTSSPIPPCGMCRQALLEVEHRQGKPIRVLLYGEEGTHCIASVRDLMPLSFDSEHLSI